MSSIKANIADYLLQIETLTNTNLQILKALNDSFFTKKNHLYAEVNDTTFVIPSFLSLENKINMLQENFENLVKSPETSEAYFNFDGNTRSIEVRKYNHTPDSIKLSNVEKFSIDSNDIFKDFMTPVPYINLDLPVIPNDIVDINVKKIVPKSNILKELFSNLLSYSTTDENGNEVKNYNTSINYSYSDIYKLLSNYKEDIDYVEYDKIYKLPIRKNIGNSTYVIESVISDIIDDDLNELITIKLRNNLTDTKYNNKLTYKLFDETIEKPLQVGDELINYDGTGKVVITEIKPITNTITVKVVNGEYLNFIGTNSYDNNSEKDIHDLSKLRFHSPVDFSADKYLKIPLEEDKYVFIAASPINSRMNVQASWGTGLIINTYNLINSADSSLNFNTYYNNNVKNIGDILFEITSMITSPITRLSESEFNEITKYKPVISTDNLHVMQINKHLNNSEAVKNIRDAYKQKKLAEEELNDIQKNISDISSKLSTISFDNGDGMYTLYSTQLLKLNERKNELTTVITNAMDLISLNANSSEIPIENAKYRIRGFHVPTDYKENVIGINVQYRYKNSSSEIGNAVSINGSENQSYIYSDWNNLNTFNRVKTVSCENGNYKYSYEKFNENLNEPSYNQIDIPISQGESVDIRLKLLYDFGQPYINVTSEWSDIVNIQFPDEFAKDVPILTIIEENNNDIETNRFNTILEISGVNNHINDSILDQNIMYYHKPDNIASGFYTDERRIIPLKEKLISMANDIADIKSTIIGSDESLKVGISIGNDYNMLYPDRDNSIILEAYNSFSNLNSNKTESTNVDAAYSFNKKVVSVMANIHISNPGDIAMKLYSLFPGNRNIKLNNTTATYFKKANYCNSSSEGVWFMYRSSLSKPNDMEKNMLQTQNQFITFRINDPYTGEAYYKPNVSLNSDNLQSSSKIGSVTENDTCAMVIYPYVSTKYGLCINSDDIRSYITINPGEEIIIPLYCEYKVSQQNEQIKKTISFDLRTSLYSDPINYTVAIIAKNTTSVTDKLTLLNKNNIWDKISKIGNVKRNSTIK